MRSEIPQTLVKGPFEFLELFAKKNTSQRSRSWLDGNGREFHRDSLKEAWLKDTVFQIHFLQLKVKMYIYIPGRKMAKCTKDLFGLIC